MNPYIMHHVINAGKEKIEGDKDEIHFKNQNMNFFSL